MKLYHYPKCSTCRKAIKFLNHNGLEYQAVDISQQAPTKSELAAMLRGYGGEVRKLFNTSGLLYREMKLKDKLAHMSDQEAIALLAANGMLVKRPFLLGDEGDGLVGFREAEWQALCK